MTPNKKKYRIPSVNALIYKNLVAALHSVLFFVGFLFCSSSSVVHASDSRGDSESDDINPREYYERAVNNEDYLIYKRNDLKNKRYRRFSDNSINYFKSQDWDHIKAAPRCKTDDSFGITLYHGEEQTDTPQIVLIKDKIISALNSADIFHLSLPYPSDAKVTVKDLHLSGSKVKAIYEITVTFPANKKNIYIGKILRKSDSCYEEWENLKKLNQFLFGYRLLQNSNRQRSIPKFPVFTTAITIIDGENGLSPILIMNKAKGKVLCDAFCEFYGNNIRGERLRLFRKQLNDVGNQIGNFHCQYVVYANEAVYSILHHDLYLTNIIYSPPSHKVQLIDNGTMGMQISEGFLCDYDLATLFFHIPARHRRDIYADILIDIEEYKKRQMCPHRSSEVEKLEEIRLYLEECRKRQFSRIDRFLHEIKKGYLDAFKIAPQDVQDYLTNTINLCIADETWKTAIDEIIEKDIFADEK